MNGPYEAPEPTASIAPREVIVADPPPPGLAQGRYDWSPWAIVALGSSAFAGAVAFMIWRLLRRRRRITRPGVTLAPRTPKEVSGHSHSL